MFYFRLFLLCGFLFFGHCASSQIYLDSITASDDAQVYSGSTGTNYGSNSTSDIKVSSSTLHYRMFVDFDLGSLNIPANAVIVEAMMSLRVNSETDIATGSTTYLQTATGSWSEGTITYANKPGTTTAGQVTSSSLLYSRRTFNVTALIQAAIANPSAFYGWEIRRNPETTTTTGNTYYCKEAGSGPPRLRVKWYIPYSISAAAITNASSTSASDGAIVPAIDNGSGGNTYQWYDTDGIMTGETGATLTGVPYGWYGIRVIGDLEDDYWWMSFLVGVDCEAVEIDYDPGPDFTDDAWLRSTASTTNYWNLQSINASNILSGTYYTAKNLLRFRLWMDPLQNPFVADLHLTGRNHYTAVRPNTSDLLKVTSAWQENGVTYATMPSSSSSILKTIPATSTSNENRVVDVRDFWNFWKEDNALNYGMLLQLQLYNGTAARMQFASSDTTHAASRPMIAFMLDDGSCDRMDHTRFRKVLDGSHAKTFLGELKFCFTEEYELNSGKKIPLTLYDTDHTVIAAIDQNGGAVNGNPLLPAVTYTFGDNRATLDLSGYGLTEGQLYVLELTRITGEKEYIKFLYSE